MEQLRISDNQRYFVKADGTPFVWIADTVWTMPQRLKWDDAEYLMKKRKSQGFTVLQIVALDPERDVQMRNPAGVKALIDDDLTKPNEAYFAYLDWILKRAAEYGFYVLLLPVWGQLVVGDDWGGGTYPKTVSEENAFWYGRFIGSRYRDCQHILWCLGGDRQPIHKGVDYRNVWRRMAEGLAAGVLGRELRYDRDEASWQQMLITYHACHEAETGECSTMSYWTDEEKWIRFIMLQSGHGEKPKNYQLVAAEYFRGANGAQRTMPVWDGEPAYEEMPNGFPHFTMRHGSWMVRKRAYWALLAGAFGHTYGHCNVWCSISEQELNVMSTTTWKQSLDAEGAEQMKILRDFLEGVPLQECRPAQELVVQEADGEMDEHVQAALHQKKEFLCAYLPSGGSCRLKAFAGETYYGWWFNPRDGRFYRQGMQEAKQPFVCVCESAKDGADTTCARPEPGEGCITCTAPEPGEGCITYTAPEPDEGCMICTAPEQGAEKDWVLLLYAKETGVPVTAGCYGDAVEAEEVRKVFEW